MVPENNSNNIINYDIIRQYNSCGGIGNNSLPSTAGNNQIFLKSKNQTDNNINSPTKNSKASFGFMKIPCFEWKNNINKGTKTAEYYLNIYYHKKKNNSSRISYNNKIKKKESGISYLEDDDITSIDDLPFTYKECTLLNKEDEKIIKILKNQIVFQSVSPEILSVIASEMILLKLPEGKKIYDISDDGNFFILLVKERLL